MEKIRKMLQEKMTAISITKNCHRNTEVIVSKKISDHNSVFIDRDVTLEDGDEDESD